MAKNKEILDLYRSPKPSARFLEGIVGEYTVRSQYGPEREIGLELELEGPGCMRMQNFAARHDDPVSAGFWEFHVDPSLRGDNAEMVLRRPVNRRILADAYKQLEEIMVKADFRPDLSHRCSVHVHVNVNHMTNYELSKFITLYSIFELYFFEVHGKGRRGNPFCLRMLDSMSFSRMYTDCLVVGNYRMLTNESFRYMAMNMAALTKFGSLEFRSHEGTNDLGRVDAWVNVLLELFDFAMADPAVRPTDLLQTLSAKGMEDFTKEYFPLTWKYIEPSFKEIPYRVPIEIAQDIAFSVDWSEAPQSKSVVKKKRPKVDKSSIDYRMEVLRRRMGDLRERELAAVRRAERTAGAAARQAVRNSIREIRGEIARVRDEMEVLTGQIQERDDPRRQTWRDEMTREATLIDPQENPPQALTVTAAGFTSSRIRDILGGTQTVSARAEPTSTRWQISGDPFDDSTDI